MSFFVRMCCGAVTRQEEGLSRAAHEQFLNAGQKQNPLTNSQDGARQVIQNSAAEDMYRRFESLLAEEEAKLLQERASGEAPPKRFTEDSSQNSSTGTKQSLEARAVALEQRKQMIAVMRKQLPGNDPNQTVSEKDPYGVSYTNNGVNDGDNHSIGDHDRHISSAGPQTSLGNNYNTCRAASNDPAYWENAEESEDELEVVDEFEPQPTCGRSIHVGVDFFSNDQYSLAKCHLKRGILLAARKQDTLMLARAHGNLANVYETMTRSSTAVLHYESCIELLSLLNEKRREAFIISNAMVSYVQIKDYDNALRLARRKLDLLDDAVKKKETQAWIEKVQEAAGGTH